MIAASGLREPRPIHPLLMLGLLAMPWLFYWILLLPGYAGSTRIAAAAYMLVPALLGLAVTLLAPEYRW